MKRIIFLLFLLFSPFIFGAEQDKGYMISGVLQKKGNTGVIRLIHSIHTHKTENEARGEFVKEAMTKFSGYVVLTILVSPITDSCQQQSVDRSIMYTL